MNIRVFYRLMLFGLLALIIVSVVAAYAAGINVPDSNVGYVSKTVTVNDLKPSSCPTLPKLTNLVSGSGTITGTSANDLIFGSSGDDIINGGDGDDCIVGGGGTDTCNGDADNDAFDPSCETQNQ